MSEVSWFPQAGAWHVLVPPKSSACRIELLEPPAKVVTPPDPADVPPKACRLCLRDVAMSFVEDEPLDEAKARGYEMVEPLADDERPLVDLVEGGGGG